MNYQLDRPIQWRVVGDRSAPPLTPAESARDGMRRLEFDQQPMPEIAAEAQVSPDFFAYRFLQFSEFASWNDVAKWANTLFEGQAPSGDDFQAAMKRIRALESDQARVAAALEFAQSQIRYFSVSLGESSHRPNSPDDVLRRRYGDCKDKSLLLVAMMRELGLESIPVLLQIGRRGGLEKALTCPQFFDHAIVQFVLAGKTYFLDPARLGQHGLLDRMGQAHDGAEVLVVSADTRDLSAIPTASDDTVADELTERATLAKLGSEGQLETRRVFRGVAAEHMRILFERASRSQVQRGIGDAMERRYPGAKLVGEPRITDDPVQNVFTIEATYTAPKLAAEREGNWFVAFKPDNMQGVVITSPSANRTTPLRIPVFPFHGRYSFEMTYPEEVSVITDPRAHTFANKYLNATVSEYFRGNIAKKTIELTTLRSSVDAEGYAGYAEDFRSLEKAIGGSFAINKAAIKSADGAAPQDFSSRLRELRQEVIKKATETIGNGKLSGTDLADAYCLRGEAYADLERFEEASQDANNAARLAPNSAGHLNCRAELSFRTGDLEIGRA